MVEINWQFIRDHLVVFRTVYSIHHDFTPEELQKCYERVVRGDAIHSDYEYEENGIRCVQSRVGILSNKKIVWRLYPDICMSKVGCEYMTPRWQLDTSNSPWTPLDINKEIEFLCTSSEQYFGCYSAIMDRYQSDILDYMNDDGEIGEEEIAAYNSDLRRIRIKELEGWQEAHLIDAKYRIDFHSTDLHQVNLSNLKAILLTSFYEDAAPFIYKELFYYLLTDLLAASIPCFTVAKLFCKEMEDENLAVPICSPFDCNCEDVFNSSNDERTFRNFTKKIFWVGDEHRTHPWSQRPGGGAVVVSYLNGAVRGYDKVKRPHKYIPKIFMGDKESIFYMQEGTLFDYLEKYVASVGAARSGSATLEVLWTQGDGDILTERLKKFQSD